jgi:hypothetical protein
MLTISEILCGRTYGIKLSLMVKTRFCYNKVILRSVNHSFFLDHPYFLSFHSTNKGREYYMNELIEHKG